jgi:hypothetical protein
MEYSLELENLRVSVLVYLITRSEPHKLCNEEKDDPYEWSIQNEVVVATLAYIY